ncbi:MAG: EAL domain-containing protein [Desulfobacteraceae bacterium]|nr:EAL domain-containing protein [Desulfobacteraceae bacterium]
MDKLSQTLKTNVKIMKSRVTKYAVYGLIIACSALVLATLLSSYFQFGTISLEGIVEVQKTNVTLWFLDAMPFIFAFWGQYTSSIMAFEASTMIIDQTSDLRDMTVALEHKAAHDATHDSVTGLPNRVLLLDRLEQAIQTAKYQKTLLGLLILDIDSFKEINDTLGHYSGDRLLKQIVSRLQGAVEKSNSLAKLDSDDFAILVQGISDHDNIIGVVKKIQKIFIEPFSIEGLRLEVQATMGIAIFPGHGKNGDTLIQRANIALYAAQGSSQKYKIYSKGLDKNNPQRLTMMGELRQAIENDELILHYQPKINLEKLSVKGIEALVRWRHPEHGVMSPEEFIPMAERTGLIKPLSVWVLNKALSQVEKWHRQKFKVSISINLSPSTFLDTELPDLIIGLLSLYDVPAHFIILEITEGSMIKDPDLAMEILTRLTQRGIKISIDDFGTGYSSLAYLKKLPVNEVKIDRSFVKDMIDNYHDAVIVKAIIDLGHNLSLNVVAEGVENKETAARLKELGCDELQGTFFSQPLSNDDFYKLRLKRTKKKAVANA